MNPELLNKINESSAKLQAGGADMSNFDSAMNKLGSISTETLSAQPEFDVSAADTKIETPTVERFQQESATDAGVRKDQKDALLDSVSRAKTEASAASETSFDDYLTSILEAPTFSQIQNQQYKKFGVDEKQLAVDKYDTQLLAEQDALRTKIERIQSKGGGLQSGAQSEIANYERESLAKQADLALLQMAAQDQLDYATNVANRAVNAMFERQEKIEGVRREIYERNKEIFDKNEQREFEISLADRERKLQAEKDAAKLLLDTKTEALRMLNLNGASEDVKAAVMAGQSPEEVINAAGQAGMTDIQMRNMELAIQAEQLNKLREKPEILRSTTVIDQGGRKMLIDSQTGEVIADFGVTSEDSDELQRFSDIQAVNQIADLRSHKGLNSSVGAVGLGRIAVADIFGAKDDFIAGVDNLTKDLTLTNLIKAKEEGATFGALSNAELSLLAESATKINNWRFGKRASDGSITETKGYDASPKDFMRELDRIMYYRVLDARKKGATDEDLGLIMTDDGKTWFRNSDGSATEIK